MAPMRVLANLLILQLSYAQSFPDRIIGGHECDKHEHRSLVLLYNSLGNFCSGTLLNSEWVLTAAHCNRDNIQIKLGVHNIDVPNEDEQIRVPAEKICCLSANNCTTFNKDIMLIKLNSSVSNSEHIAPLGLPFNYPSVDLVCSVMGWGTITSPSVTNPKVPYCANISILHNEVCQAAYPSMPGNTLCAGVLEGGTDSCRGDSGGPLICDEQLQGVVSFGGFPCAQPLEPGVYTKVYNYIGWIQGIIAGNMSASCPQ